MIKRYILNKNGNELDIAFIDNKHNHNFDNFVYLYGYMINEYFEMKTKEEVKNFIEYLQKKIEDPYLNNIFEELEFSVNGNVITDKEGSYNILYVMKEKDLIIYCSGYYMWIEDRKNNKKYFYYTD